MQDERLKEIVNRSGFPLQLRVAHFVEEATKTHGWTMLYREHAWKRSDSIAPGFIDLVLEDRNRTSVMVVECKRVLDSTWLFLIPDVSAKNRSHCRAWLSYFVGQERRYFDWHELQVDPLSPESAFCVINGQDAKATPMLERIGAELVESSEALAGEEAMFVSNTPSDVRVYFNVIVTTATLKTCTFDPGSISLTDGKLDSAAFTEVPFLRFRKQLAAIPLVEDAKRSMDADRRSLSTARESTVFVVNAERFVLFLQEFEANFEAFRHLQRQ